MLENIPVAFFFLHFRKRYNVPIKMTKDGQMFDYITSHRLKQTHKPFYQLNVSDVKFWIWQKCLEKLLL